jgi:FtsP/CotA-like multicopper oxidase with cupredoxin domain
VYHSATLGERILGHDEPIHVRAGERVLFRLLNASASMDVSLALSGHRFTVITLDGNPVPTPTTVDVLTVDVAERADVIVEMNQSGRLDFRFDRRRRPQHGYGRRHRIRESQR